ncbi:hypothetical protein OSTOST_14058, partial [Ostertagia ostertagi]
MEHLLFALVITQLTLIEEYSQSIGDYYSGVPFRLLGNLTYSFYLRNSDCDKVALWLHQIVDGSQVFTAAPMACPFVLPDPLATPPPAVVVSTPPPAPKKECIADVVDGETHEAVISIVSTLKWDPSQNSILQQLYERTLAPQLSPLGCLVGGKVENRTGYFALQYVVVNTKCNEVLRGRLNLQFGIP